MLISEQTFIIFGQSLYAKLIALFLTLDLPKCQIMPLRPTILAIAYAPQCAPTVVCYCSGFAGLCIYLDCSFKKVCIW